MSAAAGSPVRIGTELPEGTSESVPGRDASAGVAGVEAASRHEQWSVNRALTLTGFGFAQDYNNPQAFGARYQDELVVGRCRLDDIPEVILIPVDRIDLEAYFEAELQPRFAAAWAFSAGHGPENGSA